MFEFDLARNELALIAGIAFAVLAFLIVAVVAVMRQQFSAYRRAVWFYLGDNPSDHFNEYLLKLYWHQKLSPEVAARHMIGEKRQRRTTGKK